MLQRHARMIRTSMLAAALLCTPAVSHAQATTDTTNKTYATTTTTTEHHFDWGWLGLLGLLGLMPRKRRDVVETRTTTTGTGTGPGGTGRY